MAEGDSVDQTSEDVVTGVEVIDGSLVFRRYDGSEVTYSLLDLLPTEDPEVAGALWNDGGVVMLSEGP